MTSLFLNDGIRQRLDLQAKAGRLSHAILLCGEKGGGTSDFALYIAGLFLGQAHCDRIYRLSHPDVIFVKRLDGEWKYTVDLLRKVIADSVVKPNDAETKVYIFEDADELSDRQQNTLLKLIEEPPSFVRFIFTAENADKLLETVISRLSVINVPKMTVSECEDELINIGYDADDAEKLSRRHNGNFRLCVEDAGGDESFLKAENFCLALSDRDEYGLNTALAGITGRAVLWDVLDAAAEIIASAMEASAGKANACSGGSQASKRLSERFSPYKLSEILQMLNELSLKRELNVNLPLWITYIAAKIYGVAAK